MRNIQLFKPHVSSKAVQAVGETLVSGWLGLGPRVAEFEKAFSKYVGYDHSVAVGLNSCTAALHLALICAGIGEGDEVITTPMTFVSTNHVILYVGAKPVFCDIGLDMNMNAELIEHKITGKTKAILCVHYSGNPCDLETIYAIAEKHDLAVIEDAAHACGAAYDDRKIGGYSRYKKSAVCFSFHAVKNMPTGDGGMVVTPNSEWAERMRCLRWMGIDKDTITRTEEIKASKLSASTYSWKYGVGELGFKYHMIDINAAMGIEHLKELDSTNQLRVNIARRYGELLGEVEGLELLPLNSRGQSSWCSFPVFVVRRDFLVSKLKENGVHPGVHYEPNYHFPMYHDYSTYCPVAEDLFEKVLLLPMHIGLTDEDVEYVCEIVRGGW